MARLYKNIRAYHLAYDLVLDVYKITEKFPKSEDHNITSQLRRAAVSIPLNIVEGSAKASKKDFLRYLNIAYGSAKEVEVLLELCFDLNYLEQSDYDFLSENSDELNAKLFLFMRDVESKVTDRRTKFFKKFEEKVN
ncbi:four helix bundle protein [Candidatus Woesearchaeota archaeon]|jgi:four helix bundle protein|nr:four helix bundle protein [Candidatus Woesearchaeota archaeon]